MTLFLRFGSSHQKSWHISRFSMTWKVTWANLYATKVIIELNFISRTMAIFYGRNLNLASIWQIIRGLVKNAHSISAMIFFNFTFSFLYLYIGLDFGLVLRHNLNNVHYLGMKFARLHQKDLSSREGDTIFPGGGGGQMSRFKLYRGAPLAQWRISSPGQRPGLPLVTYIRSTIP